MKEATLSFKLNTQGVVSVSFGMAENTSPADFGLVLYSLVRGKLNPYILEAIKRYGEKSGDLDGANEVVSAWSSPQFLDKDAPIILPTEVLGGVNDGI